MDRGYFYVSVIFLLIPLSCFSNGGTISASLFKQTGNIKVINTEHVELRKESILLDLNKIKTAVVSVNYELMNHGNSSKVTYAFPVDFYLKKAGETLDKENLADSSLLNKVKYSIWINNVEQTLDSVTSEKYSINRGYGKDAFIRFWFVSHITLETQKTSNLKIEYSLPTEYYSSSFFEPVDYEYEYYHGNSDYNFIYDLSPSMCWKNGKVHELSICILKPDEVGKLVIADKGDFHINSSKDSITLYAKDYKFSSDSKLNIEYDTRAHDNFHNMIDLNMASKAIVDIQTSSSLEGDYSKQNLLDGKLYTAWVEGVQGNGINQWIKIKLDTNFVLTGAAVINGYAKSKNIYFDNNRAKEIEVDVIGDFYDPTQEKLQINKNHIDKRVMYLTDHREFLESSKSFLQKIEFIDYQPNGGPEYIYDSRATKILLRLPFLEPSELVFTIKDVYRGKKYQDTCISELLIFGFFKN